MNKKWSLQTRKEEATWTAFYFSLPSLSLTLSMHICIFAMEYRCCCQCNDGWTVLSRHDTVTHDSISYNDTANSCFARCKRIKVMIQHAIIAISFPVFTNQMLKWLTKTWGIRKKTKQYHQILESSNGCMDWISNYFHRKLCDQIQHLCLNFNGGYVKRGH